LRMMGDPDKQPAQQSNELATQPGDGMVLVTFQRDVAAPDGK
jgi:hypothetical protein